jgi:hypothetical protein
MSVRTGSKVFQSVRVLQCVSMEGFYGVSVGKGSTLCQYVRVVQYVSI